MRGKKTHVHRVAWMIASIRGKKPHVYRVIILKQMADHSFGIAEINQESARRVYFNISREKLAYTPDTPHVHPLSYELEWTNQKHVDCFLLKPMRDNLVPGFPRALPSPAVMLRRALGSRMPDHSKGIMRSHACNKYQLGFPLKYITALFTNMRIL